MVSILMCTYNREQYLKRAIDSVIAQTYTDWELIIVDDGSTDNTEQLVSYYADPRIQYIKMDKNRFYCYAANHGLEQCRGDYVAFQNSDDEWLPDKLEKQMRFMEEHPEAGACFTEVTLIDNDGNDLSDQCLPMEKLFENHYEEQKDWMHFFLHKGNCVCHPSALVRKSVMDEAGGFNLMYCQLADFDLWVRIVTEYPIYVIPEKLIRFRWDVNKQEQISSATEKHLIRSFNEQMLIRKQMIDRLSDEQILLFFKSEFQKKTSSSHLELEFEKAFLLMHCVDDSPEMRLPGINKLEEVLRMEGAVEVLERHFDFTLQEIYSWNQGHWYTDFILEQKISETERQLAAYQEKTKMQKNLIDQYQNSSSWRYTEPFRRVGRMVRRIVRKTK